MMFLQIFTKFNLAPIYSDNFIIFFGCMGLNRPVTSFKYSNFLVYPTTCGMGSGININSGIAIHPNNYPQKERNVLPVLNY